MQHNNFVYHGKLAYCFFNNLNYSGVAAKLHFVA